MSKNDHHNIEEAAHSKAARASADTQTQEQRKNRATGPETAFPPVLAEIFDLLLEVATVPPPKLSGLAPHQIVEDFMCHCDLRSFGVEPEAFRARAVDEIARMKQDRDGGA